MRFARLDLSAHALHELGRFDYRPKKVGQRCTAKMSAVLLGRVGLRRVLDDLRSREALAA